MMLKRALIAAFLPVVLLYIAIASAISNDWARSRLLPGALATLAIVIGTFAEFPKEKSKPGFFRVVGIFLLAHCLILGTVLWFVPQWRLAWTFVLAFAECLYLRGLLMRRGFNPRINH